jgi:hypothetical protein
MHTPWMGCVHQQMQTRYTGFLVMYLWVVVKLKSWLRQRHMQMEVNTRHVKLMNPVMVHQHVTVQFDPWVVCVHPQTQTRHT